MNYSKKKKNIEKINKIKNLLRENALIIQEYSDDKVKLSDELINNFDSIYNSIIKDEVIDKNDKDYYDKLRYILYKEIRKISDIDYRFEILKKLLESNEMIKKSIYIFQLILKNYVKRDYGSNRNNILNGDDDIIKILDKRVNKNFVLEETLLYFFEKNAFNYLETIINSKKEIINDSNKKEQVIIKLEDEPLNILKDCYTFLEYYIFSPKKLASKLIEICKLFCLGYIKLYIHTFIRAIQEENENSKFNDPNKIINVINEDNPIYKMIRIYIYKILYNNFGVDVFLNEKMIKKYKLKDYRDFNEFIQIKELDKIYKIEYTIRTLKDDNFNEASFVIEKYKKNNFKNIISKRDFDLEEFGIDNFYVISYNLILSKLQMENQDSEFNDNFFRNICEPLFKEDSLLFKAIQLFYDPKYYKEIKKNFHFNSQNIKAILFGYRYCLNELSSKKIRGIYYPLYKEDYLLYLKEQYYPGNDTKPNKVYSNIINHFITRPNEGCYVCLCRIGYYHSVKSGFPDDRDLNKYCPNCGKEIGSKKKHWYSSSELSIIKRYDYFRIFKSNEEIEEIEKDKNLKEKLKEINYMTVDGYKKKFIINDKNIEKGVYINSDKNYFKNDWKIVRNLSRITFRLLNYILYSHLFFARLVTNKNDFDKYLPKGMSWEETLYECWNILKIELLRENIDSIEKFLSYIFSDLFQILNKAKKIDNYESLIDFEDSLESNIKTIIKNYKDYNKNNNTFKKPDVDKNSFISILKETYTFREYKKEEFPFYEYFYYTDYLDEKYINKQLSHIDETRYPVLKSYLDFKSNNNKKNNVYSLTNLNLFNSVLNLINENYYNKISREYAEKTKFKTEKLYNENKLLIDKFINFVNDILAKEEKNIKLGVENPLIDFLLDDNKFGNIYKNIYKNFILKQNEGLETLIDNKIKNAIFDTNCKNRINIQQINENEIFTLSFPKEVSFIDVLFESSYRKIIDSELRCYDSYKEYEINYELIEEYMTELLLKNKKLLKENITEFIYNYEVFENQVNNLISQFHKNFNINNINDYDKVPIYKFYKDNQNNSYICKNTIKDFITLLKYKKEKNDKTKENEGKNFSITEETKIYEIINKSEDNTFSNNFIKMFDKNDNLTMDKACEIFLYYIKLIFELVKDELKKYQTELDNESKEAIIEYFKNEHFISKKDFARAIRLFLTLVLFLEEDDNNKEKKIKKNRNNLINYLRISDLWNIDIDENENFNKNLNELKSFNIKISQAIYIYEILGKEDIESNFCEGVEILINDEKTKNINKKVVKDYKNDNIGDSDNDNYDDYDQFAANSEDEDDVGGSRY